MSKERKQLLKSLLIYMDLTILNYEGSLNSDGLLALFSMNEDYPQFNRDKNRKEIISSFLEELK